MAEDNKQVEELSREVKDLKAKVDGIGDVVANAVTAAVKPIKDNLDAVNAAQAAKDAEELTGLTTKIVKANLLTEDGAKGLTLNAARELAKKAEPGTAFGVNANGYQHGGDKPTFLLPKGDK